MTAVNTPSEVLRHYARALELSSPKEWRDFVQVFDAYTTEITVAVTAAPNDALLEAKGKAVAFLHLLKIFQHTAPKAQSQPPTPPQP